MIKFKPRFFPLIFMISIYIMNLNFSVCAKEPYIRARASIALDSSSRAVLYEKNSTNIISIASTTKIMTAMVALKSESLDKKIIISDKAAGINGSTVGYKKGEIITLRELLYGLLLRSGNDAAIAIAEGVSGSVDQFVKTMNENARELGIVNTHFMVPHGLDDEFHYSTAYDLALITAKAKELPVFNEIVSTKEITREKYNFSRDYRNINKILWLLPEADGVKTGYTGDAGKCLVTSINYQGKSIIIVTLNCNERWNETKKIAEYIKDNYEYKKIASKGQVLSSVIGKRGTINLIARENIEVPVKKNQEIGIKINKIGKLLFPFDKGTILGNINVYQNSVLIYSDTLVAEKKYSQKKFYSK